MSDQGKDTRQSCFINGKLCINGIREDFEKDPLTRQPRPCNKWVRLIGRDPQTGQDVDEWCCNEWAKVKIGVEACQMTRQTRESVDKVANQTRLVAVVAAGGQQMLEQAIQEAEAQRLLDAEKQMAIAHKNGTGE